MSSTVFDPCLITGGAGNLACRLTFDLAPRTRRLVLCDIAKQPVAQTAPGCEYVCGDLTDSVWLRQLIGDLRPTSILHFASQLSVSSEENRARAWKLNIDATFALFELALEFKVQRFFFPSTTATYGKFCPDPLPEAWPQWPLSLYGVTKQSVERLGFYYHAKHGLDFRALRLPIVLSPSVALGAAAAYASQAFIEVTQTGQYTFPVRPETSPSIIYLEDVVHAIIELLAVPNERLTSRVYNIFAMCPTADAIADAIRNRIPNAQLKFAPDPDRVQLVESWPIHIEDQSARRDWGWQSRFNLDATTDHFLNQLTQSR